MESPTPIVHLGPPKESCTPRKLPPLLTKTLKIGTAGISAGSVSLPPPNRIDSFLTPGHANAPAGCRSRLGDIWHFLRLRS